jgi:hypothetical protein
MIKCEACEGDSRYHMCCTKCSDQENGEARYSLGIYAGRYCDKCWDKSGFRKEGSEGYDFLDAGEYLYEEDEY